MFLNEFFLQGKTIFQELRDRKSYDLYCRFHGDSICGRYAHERTYEQLSFFQPLRYPGRSGVETAHISFYPSDKQRGVDNLLRLFLLHHGQGNGNGVGRSQSYNVFSDGNAAAYRRWLHCGSGFKQLSAVLTVPCVCLFISRNGISDVLCGTHQSKVAGAYRHCFYAGILR